MSDQAVQARAVSGFPEFLPGEQIALERVKDVIRRGFERFGFVPVETPAVETKAVLTAKSGINNEIYAVTRLVGEVELSAGLAQLKDAVRRGDALALETVLATVEQLSERARTDIALHFDLTVPLARYVVQHKDKLAFPFRRYQMQKVWRGERPGAGRYREFYQCDIDVIGRGSLSLLADAEIPSIIYGIFRELNLGHFTIRLSNRKVLTGYLHAQGVPESQFTAALRVIDKLEKIGRARTLAELEQEAGLSAEAGGRIIDFLSERSDTDATLARLQAIEANDTFRQGVAELAEVVAGVRLLGVPDDYFALDLGIARGLDYYTGTVYETTLTDNPTLGSVCSGGRYDNLAGTFGGESFPGVGISIGLSRLLSRLFEAGLVKADTTTTAPVLVTVMEPARIGDYLRFAARLREAGIGTEIYLEKAGLGAQLKFANRKGFRLAVIAGSNEFAAGTLQIKDLLSGQPVSCAAAELEATARQLLSAPRPA